MGHQPRRKTIPDDEGTAAVNASDRQEERPRKINIVLNWLEELKQRVPVK